MINAQAHCHTPHHSLSVVQARTCPLFHLDEVKQYLRVDFKDDDAIITNLITAAMNHVENYLGRTLLKTRYRLTWQYCRREQYLDYFIVHLPMAPILSVEQVFDCCRQEKLKRVSLDLESSKPNIMFACGHEYVTIDYTAGYGDTPDAVPAEIRQATLAVVAELYRNRDTITPVGFKDFLSSVLYCHVPKRLG